MNANGAEFVRTWTPALVLAFAMLMSIIGGVFWLARVEDRIVFLEASQMIQDRRLDRMDNEGTRKLGIIEDRQNAVLRRLDSLEQRINERWGQP